MIRKQPVRELRQPTPEEIACHVRRGRRLRAAYVANATRRLVRRVQTGLAAAVHEAAAAIRQHGRHHGRRSATSR